MRILALDLATKTGWALWDGARIESGVQDFSPHRGESAGMRYLYFNRWLDSMAARSVPKTDLIFYEQNFRRGGHASEVAAGFTTRVHEFCASHAIEYGQLNAMTLKKWATGSGKAAKSAMVTAARKFHYSGSQADCIILDDNEADAILLCRYALEKFGGGPTWNAQTAAAALG